MAELTAHHGHASNVAMQRGLVKDVVDFRAILTFKQLLASGSQFDPLINLVNSRSFNYGPGVVISLQQARYRKWLETAYY